MQLSPEDLDATVALYNEHGSERAAAKAAGISKTGFHERLKRAAELGMLGYSPVMPGFRVSRTAHTFDADGNLKAEHVQQKPEPGEEFELAAGQVVKGVSALVDPDGRIIQQWIKTKSDTTTQDLVQALKATFDGYIGKAKLIASPANTDGDLMSVYPIADQHVGLMAWGSESGENYDLKIGADRLRTAAKDLIAQSPASRGAVILNLGDWQHTDDQKNMTPRGNNQLDVDGRYFKVLTTGVQLMMDVIELALQKHETVLVRNIPGNHDPHASIALTVALGAFYHSNPRVVVDDDPSDFFYHRFGVTLMGATHGHKMKPDRMAMTMAVDRREDWGATKHHWFLHGHFHHASLTEVGDVRVEGFQTIVARDAYAAGNGYRAGKSLQSVTLHRYKGEIGRHRINVALHG